jgi:hypothetical protein
LWYPLKQDWANPIPGGIYEKVSEPEDLPGRDAA